MFRIFALVSFGLFLFSLTQPGLLFTGHEPVAGYSLLLWGWWGLLTFDFPWFANVFYFASLMLTACKKIAWALLITFLCPPQAAPSYWANELYFHEGWGTPITGLGSAFYFWIGSFAVWVVALSIRRITGQAVTPNPSSPPPQNPTSPGCASKD